MAKELNRHLAPDDVQMAGKCRKTMLNVTGHEGLQSKMMSCHYVRLIQGF